MNFNYSKYIQDVAEFDFNHISLLSKNIAIPAMKESGKSTTIRYILYKLRHQIKDVYVFCGSEEEDPFYSKITDSDIYPSADPKLVLSLYNKEVEKKTKFDLAYEKVQALYKEDPPLSVKKKLKTLDTNYAKLVAKITKMGKLYALQSAQRTYERMVLEVYQEFIRNYANFYGSHQLDEKDLEELSYVFKQPASFFIFDDIFRDVSEWKNDAGIQRMIRMARHANVGMIFALHNITDIPPAFRNNMDIIITIPTMSGILEATFKYLTKSLFMKFTTFEETLGFYSQMGNKWGTNNALVSIVTGRSANKMDHIFYMPIKVKVEKFKIGRKKKDKAHHDRR